MEIGHAKPKQINIIDSKIFIYHYDTILYRNKSIVHILPRQFSFSASSFPVVEPILPENRFLYLPVNVSSGYKI
jgi:hypothetical protein